MSKSVVVSVYGTPKQAASSGQSSQSASSGSSAVSLPQGVVSTITDNSSFIVLVVILVAFALAMMILRSKLTKKQNMKMFKHNSKHQ
jgi:hypothetical protein